MIIDPRRGLLLEFRKNGMTRSEKELLKEAVKTWLVLLANDQEGNFSEAIDITLSAGEILQIKEEEMNEILDRG